MSFILILRDHKMKYFMVNHAFDIELPWGEAVISRHYS